MFNKSNAPTVEAYIDALEEPRRTHIQEIYDMFRETVPNMEPFVCSGMIGFGPYQYKSKSGCSGTWFHFGLSSLKTGISVYICASTGTEYFAESHKHRFPKATVGRSCLKFKKFEDIDFDVLREVVGMAATLPPLAG